ncbi:accessory Sec system glycosyltransferase GtfA [Streptococcus hyovaginalis]
MTVYSINKGIGWASSGVEYAQAYRASIFREIGISAQFIFTDMFQAENLAHYTQNIGFLDHEIMWLYGFFTDIPVAPTTFKQSQLEAILGSEFEKENDTETALSYKSKTQDVTIAAFKRKGHAQIIQRVEYLSRGVLIRKDYYSFCKVFSEFYTPKDGKPQLYLRHFYNQDGSIAYTEQVQGDKSYFRFPDAIIPSKEQLLERLLEELHLRDNDWLLVDRATGTGQAILRQKGLAKVGVVVHAEHYSPSSETEETILWNNYYEYQFTNADKIDAFITSTDQQSLTLARQFEQYTSFSPKIVTIPVGSIDHLHYPNSPRKPLSLLTCSRLAAEKHIDWLIEGVAIACQVLPDLSFDIYGEGGQSGKLRDLIERYNLQNHVRLCGHQDLTSVYQKYQVYLTASTSEGFGLTLLEAISSGLPIIGLDVPYGNQTFVEDGKNGYLIPRAKRDDATHYAELFAEKIVKLFSQDDLSQMHENSYRKANAFLSHHLQEAWASLLKEDTNDFIS